MGNTLSQETLLKVQTKGNQHNRRLIQGPKSSDQPPVVSASRPLERLTSQTHLQELQAGAASQQGVLTTFGTMRQAFTVSQWGTHTHTVRVAS